MRRPHQFNKHKAELLSCLTKGKDSTHSKKHSHGLDAISRTRDDRIRNFFYKAAHYICRVACERKIQAIIAGHNKGQKDEINLGNVTNQAFVSIPFEKFLSILKYTVWKYGIAYVEREESYTSKASLLDMDDIPTYRKSANVAYKFSGKRVHRGLYRSKNGILINADVNGAANTIRKEYPDAFKGIDLKYLYTTMKTVGFKDLYKKGCPFETAVKRAYSKTRRHKTGPQRRAINYYRQEARDKFVKLFGEEKKPVQAKKTA